MRTTHNSLWLAVGSDMQCGIEKKSGSGTLAIVLDLSPVFVQLFIIVVILPLSAIQFALAQGDPRTRTHIGTVAR